MQRKCMKCGSFDISRLKRNLIDRLYLKKILRCNSCNHINKVTRYASR